MKIGAAIIACDRLEYTVNCALSVHQHKRDLNEIIIVNDGKSKGPAYDIEWINNTPPYQSVGVTKNRAMKELIDRGCDQIFLIENDMIIKSPDIFAKYIETAKATNIKHLNFGYHGPANRTADYSKPNPRVVVDYGSLKLALNAHSVGAFSYFDKDFIDKVGYHDTFFKNAWEHVELCQRGISKGLLPGFWWFPDVYGSNDLIEETPGSIQNSSITHTDQWTENMKKGAEYYKQLHGWIPVHSPDTSFEEIKERLKKIYKNK